MKTTINDLYDFCISNKMLGDFDDAMSELSDVMKENGESINDLDGNEPDTFYVDFVYDYLSVNNNDFETQYKDYGLL